MDLYRSAWVDATPNMDDPTAHPYRGAQVTSSFQTAVDRLGAAVEQMRREFATIGKTAWM
jgi:hypothetical protein